MAGMDIIIKGNQIRFVYSDDMLGLLGQGKSQIQRASHVEPGAGGWQADMSPVNGPVLGPFATRTEALQHEVEWLLAHNIPKPVMS